MRRLLIPLLVILIGAATLWQQRGGEQPQPAHFPPVEALATVELIREGGPFPYRRDGSTFGNREGLLPAAPRGYYREYTVPTPGSPDRGARRIVTGGSPPAAWYYSGDHYRSFQRFTPGEAAPQ